MQTAWERIHMVGSAFALPDTTVPGDVRSVKRQLAGMWDSAAEWAIAGRNV